MSKLIDQLRAIDESGLSVYQVRLLVHYLRRGECWEGVRKTAEICKISISTVSVTRRQLLDMGLIKWHVNKAGKKVIIMRSPREQRSPHEQKRSPHEQRQKRPPPIKCSPHEQEDKYINEGMHTEKNNTVFVADLFTKLTGIFPSNNGRYLTDWETPIKQMLDDTKNNIPLLEEKLTRAVSIARGDNEQGTTYSLRGPVSLRTIWANLPKAQTKTNGVSAR